MGFSCIFVFVAGLAYINIAVIRLFWRRRAGPGWWTDLTLGWATGAALGILGGFYFEYRPLPRLRVFGAPIPAAFFHLEGPPGGEEWVDFITPAPLLFAGSNIAIVGLLGACTVGLIFWLRRRKTVDSGGT